MAATLKSRIPHINAALSLRVGSAIHAGVEKMAKDAKSRAPDRHPYGEGLPESIEARSGEFSYGDRSAFGAGGADSVATSVGFAAAVKQPGTRSTVVTQQAYGVWGAWYSHFLEFGTTHAAPRPFLRPAFEANKEDIEALVSAALRGL